MGLFSLSRFRVSQTNPRAPQAKASGHSYSTVPTAQIERSQFDLTHTWKGTFDAGLLIPVCAEEILPGDTFNVSTSSIVRLLSPLKAPIMDDIYLDFHWWFVPNRLVWSNWVRMMGEQDNPTDSIAYTVPQMQFQSTAGTMPENGSIYDNFGLPVAPFAGADPVSYWVDTLAFRAYNLTWNQWYRDQNQQDSVTVRLTDTGDLPADFQLLRRGKRMSDMLVSALPWPQKGDAVTLPLGSTAPVIGTFHVPANQLFLDYWDSGTTYRGMVMDPLGSNTPLMGGGAESGSPPMLPGPTNVKAFNSTDQSWPQAVGLVADLSSATAATINVLRTAIVFQQLLEQFARGGTRYVELIRSLFGVISPDARLQRAEFLGASSTAINVFTVPQTSETSGTPQASLAAYSLATMHGHDFVHSFTEHGQLICLASARAPYTYQQRLDKRWSRQTRFDYYMPPMAMLGEQAILMQELYVSGIPSHDTGTVFGYQERWAEYRSHLSLITGQFRSNYPSGTLDFWHLSQMLTETTVLNEDFIVENPPIDRISAIDSGPHFIADIKFSIKAVRPLPIFSVPGLTRL